MSYGAGRGTLPAGGLPQQPGISTLPDGLEQLLLGSINSSPKDLRGFARFDDVSGVIDVHHYTRGEVYVLVDSLAPAPQTIWAEIQIIAVTQGVPDLLSTGAINSFTGPLKLSLPNPSAYSTIRVMGRQIINGVASSAHLPAFRLDCRIVGRLYR